ncbi:MAG: hypothetical protein IPL09_01620 [Bacteroidetes bacterium]|nr:hypothetical protein [Bacteroidota bacterium]
METVISTSIGVIIGGLITWITSWCYYIKAGKQLNPESEKLKNLSVMIIYKLQNPDANTSPIVNNKGEITGLKLFM